MITAKTAAAMSLAVTNAPYKTISELAEKKIFAATFRGEFEVKVNYSETSQEISYEISKRLSDYLSSLGYSTSYTRTYIIIKWS